MANIFANLLRKWRVVSGGVWMVATVAGAAIAVPHAQTFKRAAAAGGGIGVVAGGLAFLVGGLVLAPLALATSDSPARWSRFAPPAACVAASVAAYLLRPSDYETAKFATSACWFVIVVGALAALIQLVILISNITDEL